MSGHATARAGRLDPHIDARVVLEAHAAVAPPECIWSWRCQGISAWPEAFGPVPLEHLLWLHFGPIGGPLTTLAIHGAVCDGRHPDRVATILTLDEHAPYKGAFLSLLATTRRPPARCREFVLPESTGYSRVWVVAGDAFVTHDGPRVEWIAGGPDGDGTIVQVLPAALAGTASGIEQTTKLTNLLRGQRGRRGRRSRWEDRTWREHAERALALKRDHPELSERAIAARLHVDERTLRNWKAWYREEEASGGHAGLSTILGGTDPDGATTTA